MTKKLFTLIALALAGAIILTAAFAVAAQASPVFRPVSLTDAKTPPTILYLLPAGGYADAARHSPDILCADGSYPTDVGAFRWNGRAIGRQYWNDDQDVMSWDVWQNNRRPHRGRNWLGWVQFDGITFTNFSRQAVLVAAWCE